MFKKNRINLLHQTPRCWWHNHDAHADDTIVSGTEETGTKLDEITYKLVLNTIRWKFPKSKIQKLIFKELMKLNKISAPFRIKLKATTSLVMHFTIMNLRLSIIYIYVSVYILATYRLVFNNIIVISRSWK